MASTPAGWYPDYADSSKQRYWDGQRWVGEAMSESELREYTRQYEEKQRKIEATSEEVGAGTPLKIGIFGAKKAAQEQAERNAELLNEYQELLTRNHQLDELVEKYGLEDDIAREALRNHIEEEIQQKKVLLESLEKNLETLKEQAADLAQSIVNLRGVAGLQSMGLYDYEHPAETSVDLGEELAEVRNQIKILVAEKSATSAAAGFTYNNSVKEGDKFVRDMSSLLLRAYNAEAENCVKGAKAGNLEASLKRLNTAKTQIERQGKMISLQVSPKYHRLRVSEIELATRYLQIVALEKEADRERRAALREDARVAKELEREMKKLSDNKEMLESALAAAEANGDTVAVSRTLEKLEAVQKHLDDVNALAANRRMGHVYVISNVGAFGPDVVKIGMTRRMEPLDRVRELGDASVPFRFDLHAMIFSEDAVGLETSLHRRFEESRVNKINSHREFFRVGPAEVLEALRSESVVVKSFTLEPAAEEYRASIGETGLEQLVDVSEPFLEEQDTDSED